MESFNYHKKEFQTVRTISRWNLWYFWKLYINPRNLIKLDFYSNYPPEISFDLLRNKREKVKYFKPAKQWNTSFSNTEKFRKNYIVTIFETTWKLFFALIHFSETSNSRRFPAISRYDSIICSKYFFFYPRIIKVAWF